MEVLAVRCCDGSQAANQQSKRVVVRLDARGVWIGRGVVWEYAFKVRRSGKTSSDCRLGLPLRESVDRSQRTGVEGDEPILEVVLERSEVLPRREATTRSLTL